MQFLDRSRHSSQQPAQAQQELHGAAIIVRCCNSQHSYTQYSNHTYRCNDTSPALDVLTDPFLPAPQVFPNRRAKPLLLLTACWTPCWACWASLGSVVWRFLAAGSFHVDLASGGDGHSDYGTSVNSAAAHRWAFGVVLRQSTPLPYSYCNTQARQP
jgi:hypothetical protein